DPVCEDVQRCGGRKAAVVYRFARAVRPGGESAKFYADLRSEATGEDCDSANAVMEEERRRVAHHRTIRLPRYARSPTAGLRGRLSLPGQRQSKDDNSQAGSLAISGRIARSSATKSPRTRAVVSRTSSWLIGWSGIPAAILVTHEMASTLIPM